MQGKDVPDTHGPLLTGLCCSATTFLHRKNSLQVIVAIGYKTGREAALLRELPDISAPRIG